jgi:hypothetical protein
VSDLRIGFRHGTTGSLGDAIQGEWRGVVQ